MTVFVLIILLLIIIVLMLFFSIATAWIELKIVVREGQNRSFVVVRALGGLIHLRFNFAVKPDMKRLFYYKLRKTGCSEKKSIPAEEFFKLVTRTLKYCRKNAQYFEYLKDRMRVKYFSIVAEVGTGDAAHTALLTGSLFTLSSIILSHLKNSCNLLEQYINITPLFDKEQIELELNCIFALKMRHIIIAGIRNSLKK